MLSDFFKQLPEKGIDPADIRQLIGMNIPFENIRGAIQALDYWCGGEWREKRFPTPLRVVYCLDNLRMIALPFLDTMIDQSKFWGIEVDGLIIHKKAFPQVAIYEASGLLRKCAYDTYQNWPGEGDHKYGVRLPTAEEVHLITANHQALQETIDALRKYCGIEFEDWSYTDYWVQSVEPPYPMSISVVEDYRTFVRLPATNAKKCLVRPVQGLFEEEKSEGLDIVGRLNRHGLPDKKAEKFAKKLRKN